MGSAELEVETRLIASVQELEVILLVLASLQSPAIASAFIRSSLLITDNGQT
ncbi:MAG: hypothetical protein V7K48_18145 [Nostoc sp.]|uniref:hypothetical protein n=1 Tax=Nostoc sp. TaxID=1180 RepID=UPI002FFC9BCA